MLLSERNSLSLVARCGKGEQFSLSPPQILFRDSKVIPFPTKVLRLLSWRMLNYTFYYTAFFTAFFVRVRPIF